MKIPFNETKFKRAQKDAVLICSEGGSAGRKVGITDREICFGNKLFAIELFNSVYAPYVYNYYQSDYFRSQFKSYMTGIIGGVSLKKFQTIMIPVPPFEEQQRIVKKVDELMKLCDKLETQQQQRSKLNTLTRKAAFDSLAMADNAKQLKDSWKRISINLPKLVDCSNSVLELRTLILELASNGCLETHQKSDTDIWGLFNSIKKIQKTQFNNREIKEIKRLSEPEYIGNNKLRINIGHVVKVISGQHLKPTEYNERQIGIPYITGPAEFGPLHPLPTKWTEKKKAVSTIGDILLTVKGSGVGKTSICDIEELAISRQLMSVRALGELNREYLAICIESAKAMFQEQKMGIAIPGIGREDVLGLKIVLPSVEEQERVVLKVKELFKLCDRLQKQLDKADVTAKNLAQATVASITGTEIEEKVKMKAPKTELVSQLKLNVSPANDAQAPLSAILIKHNGELSAKALWNYSGLNIQDFYQQLKIEMANRWIVEPEKAGMRELEAG